MCPDTPCLGGTLQSRQALRLLAQSPGVQQTPAGGRSGSALPAATPTPQRMHHNIPHCFETGLVTRAAKCAACLGPALAEAVVANTNLVKLLIDRDFGGGVWHRCLLPSLCTHTHQHEHARTQTACCPGCAS